LIFLPGTYFADHRAKFLEAIISEGNVSSGYLLSAQGDNALSNPICKLSIPSRP